VLPIVMSGAIDSVQTVINIFDPCALENLVPICQKHGVAVIALHSRRGRPDRLPDA
jgi:methylglyoxal reductase